MADDHELGKLHTMPAEEYFEADGINASGLKDVLVRPSYYQWRLANPKKADPKMRLGTLAHACILEPARFAKHARVRPDFRPVKGDTLKAQAERWEAEQPDFAIMLSAEELEKCERMRDAVYRNKLAAEYLAKGTAEGSLFWEDPRYKVRCKARPDFVSAVGGAIIDLKTTKAADPAQLGRVAMNLHYDLQAAHYLAGGAATGTMSGEEFYFLVVETEGPGEACLYELDAGLRASGIQWLEEAMETYCRCKLADAWPGLPEADQLPAPNFLKLPDMPGGDET